MKKILFCLFGIILSLDALSQSVCVELSVHWQLEKDIFNKDSIVNTPFLHITYRNNSNKNHYCPVKKRAEAIAGVPLQMITSVIMTKQGVSWAKVQILADSRF